MSRIIQNQNLIDIAVQEHGGSWIKGLMQLMRDNPIDLKNNPPVAGQPLVITQVNETGSVRLALKRDTVSVSTGDRSNITLWVDGQGDLIVDGQGNGFII